MDSSGHYLGSAPLHLTTHQPLIYQASDVNFRNPLLKDEAYIAIALVDSKLASSKIHGNKITSDSIIIVPENSVEGQAIQVRGFTDCSMASVFASSDPTLPGILFSLSILSMMSIFCIPTQATGSAGRAARSVA